MISIDYRVFLKVAENLSFSDAGKRLGVSRSAVSKRVAQLEQYLGTKLINRTPRSLSLTEAGTILLEHCRGIERAVEAAEDAVKNADQEPVGTIQVSLPTSLGAALMPSLLTKFSHQYPRVKLTTHLSERFVDVVAGGYDLVIRVAQQMTDSSLVAQRLLTCDKVLVASPAYLQTYGTPKHVSELQEHRCLGLSYNAGSPNQWRFNGPRGPIDVPIKYAFAASNHMTLSLAACLGMGFLFTPRMLVAGEIKRDRLQIVLPEGWTTAFSLYIRKSGLRQRFESSFALSERSWMRSMTMISGRLSQATLSSDAVASLRWAKHYVSLSLRRRRRSIDSRRGHDRPSTSRP